MKLSTASIIIAACFSTVACSSAPTPTVPSGISRQPINTPEKIEEYKTTVEVQKHNDSTALERQVAALTKKVSELQTIIIYNQIEQANKYKYKVNGSVQTLAAGKETIEVKGQSVVFRKSEDYGKADFIPSAEFKEKLLQAASQARFIEIRGRTDSNFDNPADRRIAEQRATRTKRFLISNGIPANKIKISYMSFGGFIADNKTAEGRSLNRRVEVEAMDLNTSAFETKPYNGAAK